MHGSSKKDLTSGAPGRCGSSACPSAVPRSGSTGLPGETCHCDRGNARWPNLPEEQRPVVADGGRILGAASALAFVRDARTRHLRAPVAGELLPLGVRCTRPRHTSETSHHSKKTGPRRRCDEGLVTLGENRNCPYLQALADPVKLCPFRARLGSQTQHKVTLDDKQPASQDRPASHSG